MSDIWCVVGLPDETGFAIPVREIVRIDFLELGTVSIQTSTYTEEVDGTSVALGIPSESVAATIRLLAGCRHEGDTNETEHQSP